ncbi:BED-type domain-containing protein [Citrus sinensis]|nr:BED-type domain-containing protein [Citrus sinensis]
MPLRLNVWAHFTKLPCGNKGKCHHCRKTFAANRGNTTNLKNHLDKCRSYQDVKVEGDLKQQILFRQKGKDKDDGVVKVSGGFSQEACKMALVKMIVKDELPFSFVEAEGFLEFMQTCCLRFDVPSRRTITRDILELYQYEKGLLKSVLGASKQRVCITTDTWTSIQLSNYMVITAHFIDAEWVLHKRILSFTPIANNKGDGIGKLIETYELAEVNHSIASIRNAIKSVRSSPARLQKFKTCVGREKISYGGLMVLNVPTRWNSTYLMLHKTAVFEKTFDRMKEDDQHYVNWFVEDEGEKKREGPPSDDNWGNARRKVEELKSNIKELLMKLYNSYIGGSDVRNSGGVCFGDIHDGSSGGGGGGGGASKFGRPIVAQQEQATERSNWDLGVD